MTDIKRSGFVAIIGRPNVGKSTLLNAMIGEKIAIVTPKPQTTRNRITGILNIDDAQIVFIDTPGIHKPRTRLGDYMVNTALNVADEVDIILLVVEAADKITPSITQVLDGFKTKKRKLILAINKIDRLEKSKLLSVISEYSKLYDFETIIPLSAKKGDGVSILINELKKHMEEGPQFYPDDQISDQPEKQQVAEIIREKLLLALDEELPHGTAVEIESITERENSDVIDISALIYCEKDNSFSVTVFS